MEAELHNDPFSQWSVVANDEFKYICKLWDCADFFNGRAFKPFEINLARSGLPIIKITELKYGISESTGYYDGEYEDRHIIDNGDILFSWSGNPTTSIDIFIWRGSKAILNQHTFKVSVKHPELEQSYFYYVLKYMKSTFIELARDQATSMGHVKVSDLKTLICKFPKKEIQRTLAQSLRCLDDKIELNNQMNETLEAMARAIFKEWFIDFGPVRAKAEGRRPFGMDDETVALFPDSFEESELGMIPKGWRVDLLGSIISVKHGYAFKGEYFTDQETKEVLLTPGNFKIGGGFKSDKLKFYNGPILDDYILKKDDLVITMTDLSKAADTLGYPAFVPFGEETRYHHNQRIGLVKFSTNEDLKLWIYELLKTDSYRSWIVGSCTGSTVKHTAPTRIEEYKFVSPPLELAKVFSIKLYEIYEQIGLNEIESKTLSQLRDTLLPRLISGEITLELDK